MDDNRTADALRRAIEREVGEQNPALARALFEAIVPLVRAATAGTRGAIDRAYRDGYRTGRDHRGGVAAPGRRIPYVGDGVDGARRSAAIDRSEADTVDRATEPDRYTALLASAERWETQADELEAEQASPNVGRRFYLVREFDVTEVTGTGLVAAGIEFPDRSVALRWLKGGQSTAVWPNIELVRETHCHDKSPTALIWVD